MVGVLKKSTNLREPMKRGSQGRVGNGAEKKKKKESITENQKKTTASMGLGISYRYSTWGNACFATEGKKYRNSNGESRTQKKKIKGERTPGIGVGKKKNFVRVAEKKNPRFKVKGVS